MRRFKMEDDVEPPEPLFLWRTRFDFMWRPPDASSDMDARSVDEELLLTFLKVFVKKLRLLPPKVGVETLRRSAGLLLVLSVSP